MGKRKPDNGSNEKSSSADAGLVKLMKGDLTKKQILKEETMFGKLKEEPMFDISNLTPSMYLPMSQRIGDNRKLVKTYLETLGENDQYLSAKILKHMEQIVVFNIVLPYNAILIHAQEPIPLETRDVQNFAVIDDRIYHYDDVELQGDRYRPKPGTASIGKAVEFKKVTS